MIFKNMYVGYKKNTAEKVRFLNNPAVITCSAADFEDKTFVYYECKDVNLDITRITDTETVPFPDGESWMPMAEIFHYFTPRNDGEWQRRVENKTPVFSINKLEFDKIASYIYYHQVHQNQNPYNFDKFFSIFIYGDLIVMYRETPEEKITWQEIEGKVYAPNRQDWNELMDVHFKQWPSGTKGWLPMETE